jgi:hypothetical protein
MKGKNDFTRQNIKNDEPNKYAVNEKNNQVSFLISVFFVNN